MINMIPVIVKPFSDVFDADLEIDSASKNFSKVQKCYNCGSLLFYIRISRVENTNFATDTETYCAVCGANNGGIYNDPFEEMKEGELK